MDKEYIDITLKCIDYEHPADIAVEFLWSIDEQKFFDEKGLTNPPKRCKICRQRRRLQGQK